MAGYPPPYPPPGPPYGPPNVPPYTQADTRAWKYQRRMLRDQAKAQRDQYRYQMRGLRRSSILGPIMVVLVGVVFLLVQTGRLQSDHLWLWYGHWWPLLLIVAGAILLAEWGFDQLRPQDPQRPYVRRSIGGGVITLVILLAITGAIFSGIHNRNDFFGHHLSINPENIDEFLGDKHESDQSLVEAFPLGGGLTIDNPRGDIKISGVSSDNQIHIALHKQVYSRSDSDAENKSRDLTPRIVNSNKMMAVSMPNMNGAVADLTITVPSLSGLTINANHGDVHIDTLKSPVIVTANHGDVELSTITGPVRAHVNNHSSSFSAHRITGPLALEGNGSDLTVSDVNGPVSLSGDFYGTTHLEHITSAVKFHTSRTDFQLARLDGEMEISPDADLTADQAVGPVVLTTRNRNITLERISGDLSVTNRNGSVDLTSAPPMGNITVENRHGSVNLTLPDHANFGVTAETTDGSIQNDFSLPSADHEQKATITGTVGKGGPLVRITTSQGDVSVRKASIAPLPPAPPMPPTLPSRPQVSINGDDGSSVYVGKDGVRIISGADGSSVIVGKDGLKITSSSDGAKTYRGPDGTEITSSSDGSKVYKGSDGTRLVEGSDGSKDFVGSDGTHFTEGSDGSKVYKGSDGTRISIGSDGNQTSSSPSSGSLNQNQVREQLRRAEDRIRKTEQHRDELLRGHSSDKYK